MSNSAKNNTIAFKFIMCVYSYQNRLNPCLEGSELRDPASDIADEEVLSSPSQAGPYFEAIKKNCEYELHLPKHPEFE